MQKQELRDSGVEAGALEEALLAADALEEAEPPASTSVGVSV